MKAVTLYEQDRTGVFADLCKVHQNYIEQCLKDVSAPSDFLTPETKVSALEQYLDVNYVDKKRDLSQIAPIPKKEYYIEYCQKDMQPLLDALEKGDFELAEALTPEKLRLIGYNEEKKTRVIHQAGHGWAGQFEVTEIPPGIYPIFTDKFSYHEANHHYTNEVNYLSVYEWFEGTCVASSDIYFEGPEPNVVFEKPYSFSLARSIMEGQGNACLIYPFNAIEYPFEDEGQHHKTYKIVDVSVPYQAEENPIKLRGRCIPPEPEKAPLFEKIRQAESKREHMESMSPENVPSTDRTTQTR